MATKKINRYLAIDIAGKIANKAFEHLLVPAEAALEAFSKRAVAQLVEEVDVPALLRYRVVSPSDVSQHLAVGLSSDGSEDSDIRISGYTGFTSSYWHCPRIVNDALYAEMLPTYEHVNNLRRKQSDLSEQLHRELEGKTTSQAMKAWPEAADLIAEVSGCNNPNHGFTTPLESLLMKFLPMLPAPTMEGV